MTGIKIVDKGVLGVQIDVPYATNLGSEKAIYITVSEFGINVAATSELNIDGVEALDQALAIAKAIQKRGFVG